MFASCEGVYGSNFCKATQFAGGAVAMTGLTPDEDPTMNGVPLDPPPSSRQGYGRMQLGTSLPLSGGTLSMQVS